jgi:hypothetical protein
MGLQCFQKYTVETPRCGTPILYLLIHFHTKNIVNFVKISLKFFLKEKSYPKN